MTEATVANMDAQRTISWYALRRWALHMSTTMRQTNCNLPLRYTGMYHKNAMHVRANTRLNATHPLRTASRTSKRPCPCNICKHVSGAHPSA